MEMMLINKKTGKKEKHIQCVACCRWIPISEFSHHQCEEKRHNLGLMFL